MADMAIQTGQTVTASDFVGNPAPFLSLESTSGVTHSLATVANQRVMVVAKGYFGNTTDQQLVRLKYNGATKDYIVANATSSRYAAFSLMYMEVLGAATHNITIETVGYVGEVEGAGATATLYQPKIMISKLLIG